MLKKFVISGLLMLLVGCSANNSISFDVENISKDLVEKLDLSEKVIKLDKEDIESLLYLDEGTLDEGILYLSNTNTSDMVGIVSSKDINELESTVKQYIEDLKVQNTNYFPEEVTKLEEALIEKKGDYVIFIVSNDNGEASKLIGELK